MKCNVADGMSVEMQLCPIRKAAKQGNGSWKAGKLVGMQAEAKVKGLEENTTSVPLEQRSESDGDLSPTALGPGPELPRSRVLDGWT